jgi:hypothetical protein
MGLKFCLLAVVASVILWGCTTRPTVLDPDYASQLDFDELMERAQATDSTLNFTDLRMAYTLTGNYNPYDRESTKTVTRIYEAMDKDDCQEALALASRLLEKNPLDIDLHFVSKACYRETGDSDRFKYHDYMADGLLRSILSSGDGKSTESAYVVISVDEEHALLHALNLRGITQGLLDLPQGHFDELKVFDQEAGEEFTVFFNIDIPWAYLEK